jgi:protein-tyrosine phosphatase
MGIGRTSLVIAGVLLSLQIKNIDEVFNFLSEKRTLKVPDTEEQITWIAEKTLNP